MGRHVLIDPTGQQLPLDGTDGIELGPGYSGRYAPPIQHLEDAAVGRDGTVLRGLRYGAKDVVLPLGIGTDDMRPCPAQDYSLNLIRGFMTRFSPRRGDSRLRYESDASGARELVGRISQVLAPDDAPWADSLLAVVTFRAHDPFWRDPQNIILNFALDPPDFFPVPPLELRLSTLSEEAVILNDGDVEAWPVWQIRGPTPGPVVLARNGDEPQVLKLDRELIEGEAVTIDTRPGRKTVVSSVGGSIFADLTSASALWPLVSGSQTVTVDVPSPIAATLVTMSYRRRWFTP